MAFRPLSGNEDDGIEVEEVAGERRMSALEVFFWRRE
jgi:hypothetical protein